MMRRMILAAAVCYGLAAYAADEDVVHFRMHIDRTHIVLNADGTNTSDYEASYTLLTAAAVQEGSQRGFSYNPDFDNIDVTAAWVEHADGTRTDVDLATAVHDRSQPVAVAAPMLTQDRLKLLVFPDVKIGDTLHYQTHSVQHRTLYPNQFNTEVGQHLDQLTDDSEFTIDAPASMPLYVESTGFKEVDTPLPNDMLRRSWHISVTQRKPYEEGQLALVLTSPHVIASTFADYAALAAAYRAGAADKSTVTPAIQALADEIAGSTADPREVALRLSDWVSRNIRYVALYFGAGGVVPVPADDVLKNRYGDCKGHAILLEALLKARGIASSGALIDASGTLYRLPKATLANGFNHIITYVPSLDLWLDSTATDLPLGTLPESETGKPTLLTATGEVKYVPVVGTQKMVSWLDAKLKLGSTGDVNMSVNVTLHGAESTGARQFFRNMQPQGRRDFVRAVLSSDGLAGNGELTNIGAPDALNHDYSYAYDATLYGYAAVPGPFGFGLPQLTTFQGLSSILQSAEYYVANTQHRESEYVCYNFDTHEHFSLTLPDGVKLLSIPANMDVVDGDYHYLAQYHVKGRVLDVDRALLIQRDSRVCPAGNYERYRPFFAKVLGNLRGQILYQPLGQRSVIETASRKTADKL